MTCTAPDCGIPTSVLHLCDEHLAELKDLLDGVDFLIVNLDPAIQAGKVIKKPGGQEGGNGTKSAESRPPTTDTNQLRYWLWELPTHAYNEARDNPQAGRTLFMARIWVPKARNAVYGADDETPRNPQELKQRLEDEVPKALRVKPLIEWLKAKHGLIIKPDRIYKWQERGHITRNNTTGYPTYDPAAVAIHAKKELT